jgi:hypothetical protein
MLGKLALHATHAGVFDPAYLSLTGFWRNYTNPTWSGTASAGSSGSNSLTDPGTEPAQGTALNGWGTANFNGTDDHFTASGTLDTYIAATAFTMGWLIKPDTVTPGADLHLWKDSNSAVMLHITTAGNVRLTVNGSTSVSHAISASVYSLVLVRYTGSAIQIGVNELPGADGGGTTAAFSSSLTLTGTVDVGSDGAGFDEYDGHIAEILIADTSLSDAVLTNYRAYINSRYALSL